MNMNTSERYKNLDPDQATALTLSQQIQFFSFNNLVVFVAGKLTIAQAKAVPELLDRNCVLYLLEGFIDAEEVVRLTSTPDRSINALRRKNLPLVCGPNGKVALREGLFRLDQMLSLPTNLLSLLLIRRVFERLRSKSITAERALQEINLDPSRQAQPPGQEHPCAACQKPGGQPDSHWYWRCPVADIPPSQNQRYEQFVAVLHEYIAKSTTTVRMSELGALCRKRGVYAASETLPLKPLNNRAFEEGLLILEGDQALKEAILLANEITDFIHKIEIQTLQTGKDAQT